MKEQQLTQYEHFTGNVRLVSHANVLVYYHCKHDCVSLLTGESECDKRAVVIHILHSQLQLPSKVSVAQVSLVTEVPVSYRCRKHLPMALIC
jgi:hypothetical protein